MKINRASLDTLIRNMNVVAMGTGTTYSVVQVGRRYSIRIRTSNPRAHAGGFNVEPMTVREAYYAVLGMISGRMQERVEQAIFAESGTLF